MMRKIAQAYKLNKKCRGYLLKGDHLEGPFKIGKYTYLHFNIDHLVEGFEGYQSKEWITY